MAKKIGRPPKPSQRGESHATYKSAKMLPETRLLVRDIAHFEDIRMVDVYKRAIEDYARKLGYLDE